MSHGTTSLFRTASGDTWVIRSSFLPGARIQLFDRRVGFVLVCPRTVLSREPTQRQRSADKARAPVLVPTYRLSGITRVYATIVPRTSVNIGPSGRGPSRRTSMAAARLLGHRNRPTFWARRRLFHVHFVAYPPWPFTSTTRLEFASEAASEFLSRWC